MRTLLTFIVVFFVMPFCALAADYKIDSSHSTVGFKVRHLTISSVTGRFGEFEGSFSYDPANLSNSKTEAVIKAVSINTDRQKRDDHLPNPDFFDAPKFPEIKFKSTAIKDATADSFRLVGDLTIRDVTKSVVLDVHIGGVAKDPQGKERAAFSATTKINRKDYGIAWNKQMETGGFVVGDEVTINIEIEGVKQ